MDDSKAVFRIIDNGKEISDDIKELIFEPGYTSKYDPNTGLISTGLGLAHVKMLTEHLNGTISINSPRKGEKEFMLAFPTDELISGR
jgi:two-component system sensor histidine kinase YcbA